MSVETEDGGEKALHSSQPGNRQDVLSNLFNQYVNKPFRVIMRKDYSWKQVEGLDSIMLRPRICLTICRKTSSN